MFESLEVTFMPIMEKLRTERIRMGCTIFFANKTLVQGCICFFGSFLRPTSLTLEDILTSLNSDLWTCIRVGRTQQ